MVTQHMSITTYSKDSSKHRTCAIVVAGLALNFLIIGCKPKIDSVHASERLRAVQSPNFLDQSKLAKVALEDEKDFVREAAVTKLTNQKILAKVAIEDNSEVVREAAMESITDPILQANVRMWYEPELTRNATDVELLERIATEARDPFVRWSAAMRLVSISGDNDQPIIIKLAVKNEHQDVRMVAVSKLTNQKVLFDIAKKEKHEEIRLSAVDRLTDQSMLCEGAQKIDDTAVRMACVRKISDNAFLLQILNKEYSGDIRCFIINTFNTDKHLRAAAITAYHQSDRELAASRLKKMFPESEDYWVQVDAFHSNIKSKAASISSENDENKLLELTLNGQFDVWRTVAAQNLRSSEAITNAANQSEDIEVLKIILDKLDDWQLMTQIAWDAKSIPMRIAVSKKCGIRSWEDIFLYSSAKNKTPHDLENAFTAVSLFRSGQSDVQEAVSSACANLLLHGDDSRIPEMIKLLNSYGNKWLATCYINCGEPDLITAGEEWARKHGYTIIREPGPEFPKWGSGR